MAVRVESKALRQRAPSTSAQGPATAAPIPFAFMPAAAAATGAAAATATAPKTTKKTTGPKPTAAAAAVAQAPALAYLQQLDQRVTMPFLTLPSLGCAEYALCLPGSWFGVPVYGLLFASLAVASVHHWDSGYTSGAPCVTVPGLLLAIVFWYYCVWESLQDGIDKETMGMNRLFKPLGKALKTVVDLATPHLAIWAVKSCGGNKDVVSSMAFYIANYLVCQLLIELLKTLSRRYRPVIAVKDRLKGVARAIPQNQWILRQPHHEQSSFPSGDVGGMTAFVTTCLLVTSQENLPMARVVGVAMVLTSMFGRMYFQAHFAGDVSVGALVGLTSTLAFNHLEGPFNTMSWRRAGAIEIVVILLWACVQKLKPKSMESENNMSNLTGTGAAVLRKISTEWFAKPRTAAAAGQGGDVTKRKHANVAVLDKTWLK